MANTHMGRCTHFKPYQGNANQNYKTTSRVPLTLVKMAIIKKLTINADKDVGMKEPIYIVGEDVN
jgi:hypothetical protein